MDLNIAFFGNSHLKQIPKWSKNEALEMAKANDRENYLKNLNSIIINANTWNNEIRLLDLKDIPKIEDKDHELKQNKSSKSYRSTADDLPF